MSSRTFCLHGYSELYFSFIPCGIWAFEQIHTTLVVLTHKTHHKFPNTMFFNIKYLGSAKIKSWAEVFPISVNILYERMWQGRGEQQLTKGHSRNTLLLWNKLLIANLSLFMPTLWFIAALSWKEFFLFCLFPSCITDNSRTLLIFPFTTLSNIILLQSSRWEYLFSLIVFTQFLQTIIHLSGTQGTGNILIFPVKLYQCFLQC